MKEDRRVKYTKALLRDALVLLLKQQHISKISVKALCESADVNRSTFYAHFTDQYDLLRQVEGEVMDNLKAYLDFRAEAGSPISQQNLTGILEHARSNKDLYTALLSENCDLAFQKDLMGLTQIVPFQTKAQPRTKEYLSAYAIYGCISMLQLWLQDGTQESPEEMSELVLQMLFNGLSSFR